MKKIFLLLVSLLAACNWVFADRTLSADETQVILNYLAGQPTQTWMPAGSITARRLEYSTLDKSICEYREITHFDGTRFYREILLISGEAEMESESVSDLQDSLELDRQRIFCWDGSRYTQYYKSTNSAIIVFGQSQISARSYGVFSVGVIPWGNGMYSSQKLSGYQCSAQEVWVDEHKQIHLQMTNENSSPVLQMNFILDAEKNYAVLLSRIEDPQLSGIEQTYSQFIQVNNRWIPTVMTIERFFKKPEGKETVSYEDWKIESITPETPSDALFSVSLKNGTFVEYHPADHFKSLMYYANEQKDIDSLLAEKTAFSNQTDSVGKNCAAAAVQLVTKHFSLPYPTSQIESLSGQENNMTSLYLLKRKLEETGLDCIALETNLESLRETQNAQVILHMPNTSHYVILDSIDDTNVWTIDLTSRKVYWKTPIQQFLQEWKNGTALIVSDNPQNLNTAGTPLSESAQQQITGGDVSGTLYSCSEQIQFDKELYCPEPMGIVCNGRYYMYWERWGCAADPNGNGCIGEGKIGHQYTRCETILGDSVSCNPDDSDWRNRLIRACQ